MSGAGIATPRATPGEEITDIPLFTIRVTREDVNPDWENRGGGEVPDYITIIRAVDGARSPRPKFALSRVLGQQDEWQWGKWSLETSSKWSSNVTSNFIWARAATDAEIAECEISGFECDPREEIKKYDT